MKSFFGDREFLQARFGDRQVNRIYLGDRLSWEFGPIVGTLRKGDYTLSGSNSMFRVLTPFGTGTFILTGFNMESTSRSFSSAFSAAFG